MTDTIDTDSDAQTYQDAHLEAASYAAPDAFQWQYEASDATVPRNVGRRAFMAGVGAAAVASVAGTAAAQSGGGQLNFGYDLVHDPWITADVTVETHEPDFDQFNYIADDESVQSLPGATLADREDDTTPHNPVRIRGDLIDIDDYRRFPAELTTTNADGDDVDASALDSEFWTTDASGSTGSISVTEEDDALNIAATGQAAGDVVTASFTDFTIDDGEQRRVLQLVADVNTLAADAVVTVKVVDAASNTVSAVIDASADGAADSTIATTQGSGIIYQQQLGELTGGENLDTIEEVVVEVTEADADVTLHGLNLESASRWQFGQREQTNTDDELVTKTVYEQTGWFGITSLETLYDSDRMSNAVLEQVKYDAAFRVSELPSDYVEYTFEDSGRSDFDRRMRFVYNYEFPTAYALDITLNTWYDEVVFQYPGDRYMAMEIATGLDEQVTLEEARDDESTISWTSRTSTYTSASEGDEIELSGTPTSDAVLALQGDVLYRSGEENEATAVAAMGPTGRAGGGILSTLSGKIGAILSAVGLAGVANYIWGS
ncbi:hypothetical protein [Halorubrum salinum]|uniref:hypothetical protein n=1 Tax=Halorubrum salinum TaxID=767517 RepID=UPI002111A503|nr:hypothetical protein [Halorubrum salinum]